MTGMNAARHGVTNWTLRKYQPADTKDNMLEFPAWNLNGLQPDKNDTINQTIAATTLPQILRNNGYFTIHSGKAHWGAESTPGANPLNLGFDVNIGGHCAGGPGSYLGTRNFSAAWRRGDPVKDLIWDVPGLEKYYGKDINLTDALTLEAKSAMDNALKKGKPFYLYMSHYAVHVPLEPHNPYYQKYKDKGLEEPEALYASMVEGMDKSLGDLMNYLEEKGIARNTVIVFMSDNGGLSVHGRGGIPNTHNLPLNSGKGSAYEGGIREPMIVKWHFPNKWGPHGPGIGSTSTIRSSAWKLIYWYEDQHFELFNIDKDIGEHNNLAEENPEKVKELASRLGNYLRGAGALRPYYKKTGKLTPWPDDTFLVPSKLN